MKQHPYLSVILLAGGQGLRLNPSKPKQYLSLNNKKIALHSLDFFLNLSGVNEIIIVCDEQYQNVFTKNSPTHYPIKFATPGTRRQDSVYSGLTKVSKDEALVIIHDCARPFIPNLEELIAAGIEYGAAVLGIPLKFTVKESTPSGFVSRTLKRENIWEIQTPQIATKELLMKGFEFANQNNLTVTDDVSLVELIGHPVKLIKGSESNIKITTPLDLELAKQMMEKIHDESKEELQTSHSL